MGETLTVSSETTDFDRFLAAHRHRQGFDKFPPKWVEALNRLYTKDPMTALRWLEDHVIIMSESELFLKGDDDVALKWHLRSPNGTQKALQDPRFREKMMQIVPSYFLRAGRFNYEIENALFELSKRYQDREEADRLISGRIATRGKVLEDVARQAANCNKTIDVSHHDWYSSPAQTKNYGTEILNPHYRMHPQAMSLLEALANHPLSRPKNKKVRLAALASGTGLTELVFLAMLRDSMARTANLRGLSYEEAMRAVQGLPRENMSVILYERSDAPIYGRIVGEQLVTPNLQIRDKTINPDSLNDILAETVIDSQNTSIYVTLINRILNLPRPLQQEYLHLLASFVHVHPDKDTKVIVDLPLLTPDKRLQTNYDGPKDAAFNEYQAREILLIPPQHYQRKVWKERDESGNLVINIGVEITNDYRLTDHFGKPAIVDGQDTVLKKGTRIYLTSSMRFTSDRVNELATIGGFKVLDHVTLGTKPTAHVLLYKS